MTDAFPLEASASFWTATSTVIEKTGAGGSTAIERWGVGEFGPFLPITYDAATDSYTVSDDSGSVTLGSANLISSSRNYDTYEKQAGTVRDQLKLYGNAGSGGSQLPPSLQLTYQSFGVWTHTDSDTGEARKTYFVFGFRTADASMPRTGSASYRTFVTGNMHERYSGTGRSESALGGSATFKADFGSGAIDTTLSLNRVSDQTAIGTFVGTGMINTGPKAGQFSGSFSSTMPYFNGGSFQGAFSGPEAKEMGYAFAIWQYNPDPYAGATPMRVDNRITGIVVGAKN